MITLSEFQEAARIIKGKVTRTPLLYSPTLSHEFGCSIHLKLENLQRTGSFKIRGATYKLLARRKEIGPGGVIGASAGNHAQGLALAATQAGLPSTIVMPEWVSISKQEATRSYGGDVIIRGESLEESIEIARDLARKGRTFIHPYDDPDIIIGQGTIALEVFEDLPDVNTIISPVGGGGLISGIAMVAGSLRPEVRVIGVQSARCPSAYEAMKQRKAIRVRSQSSIADGISVKEVGKLNLEIMLGHVAEVLLVEERHIASAMLTLLERKKILAEGAGAVPIAALMAGALKVGERDNVVLIVSGGNVDSPLLGRVINQGLTKNGRIMRFLVRLDDVPGSLSRLLNLIAGLKANVLDIRHERHIKDAPLYVTHVELELETRGESHCEEISRKLMEKGYHVEIR